MTPLDTYSLTFLPCFQYNPFRRGILTGRYSLLSDDDLTPFLFIVLLYSIAPSFPPLHTCIVFAFLKIYILHRDTGELL